VSDVCWTRTTVGGPNYLGGSVTLSPAATTSAPTAGSTRPPTPHQRAPAAPKRTDRSSLPSSPQKRGLRTECCTLAGQQQFAFPGMAGGRLLHRAGGWFPPPEAGRRGGPPTRAGGRSPARLALRPSKDDECHTRVSGHQDPGANIITRCAGTKSHTYDESWHRIECHNFTI
jgi:hypothetical protein